MDSWNYSSEEKGFSFPEGGLPIDAMATSRKALMGWDYGSPCNIQNGLISDGEVAECMEFMGMGVSDNMKNYFTLSAKTASSESYSGICKKVASPNMVSSSSSLGEEETKSKFSSSLLEGNIQKSSLIDLKLGRHADCKEPQNIKVSKAISFGGFSSSTKKTRSSVLNPQTPFCQVHGCNMDLSSSKDYHKRHRVCDVHSKTPKVTVNGVEQRFCQQCSRFHLLAEFDDTKRSCRRRLAGHNERRRKPQSDTISCRPQKMFQCYPGSRFLGTPLPKGAPIVFPNISPGGIFNAGKHEQADQRGNVNRVEQSVFSSHLPVSLSNGHLFLESYSLRGPGKLCSSMAASSKTENHVFLDPSLDVRELTRVSSSSSALSLLSADSDNLTNQSAIFAASNSIIFQGSQAQRRGMATGISLGKTNTSDGFYSCGMNNVDVDSMASMILSDVTHQVESDETYQNSYPLNPKYSFPPEHGSTVDLIQLSSHLQRVEQERDFIQGKLGNDNVWFPKDLGYGHQGET